MTAISLPARLAALARTAPGSIALTGEDGDLTYAALEERVATATTRLAGEWAVVAGERIAFLGFNHVDQITLLAALMRLGALLVPLNYRLAIAELRAIAGHAGIAQVVADDHHAAIAGALGVPVRARDALVAPRRGER
ncbi:MAG: AMP-binding protein, partial [Betaproteobacteria bacterium]